MHHVDGLVLGLLLFVACLVAIVARRIGLPYAIGLVIAGMGLSLAGYHSGIVLSTSLILTVLLPPLVFEAALHLRWPQFRREMPLVMTIAVLGTLVSAVVVAVGMHSLAHWGWPASLMFGSLIAATDPVSVIAMMKEHRAEKRLRFLMEAESLVNDGAAAVLYALVVTWISRGTMSTGDAYEALMAMAGGGVLCGLAVALALLLVAGRSDDHLVELTLTVLAAYGSFLLAENLGMSGVLATLAAGMLVGNWGRGRQLTERGGRSMIDFWDFAAFLANSVVFLLIGSRTVDKTPLSYWLPAVIAIALVLIGRAAAVYPVAALFSRSRLAVDRLTQHIMVWGGLRGALALALALAVPAWLPEHDALIGVAFAVVAFSIIVQGLTVPRLLAKAKTNAEPDEPCDAKPLS